MRVTTFTMGKKTKQRHYELAWKAALIACHVLAINYLIDSFVAIAFSSIEFLQLLAPTLGVSQIDTSKSHDSTILYRMPERYSAPSWLFLDVKLPETNAWL